MPPMCKSAFDEGENEARQWSVDKEVRPIYHMQSLAECLPSSPSSLLQSQKRTLTAKKVRSGMREKTQTPPMPTSPPTPSL